MADVNERRKAQNRTAQKKYRELVDAWPETEPLVPQLKPGPKKQRNHKLRIELARAILCDKPHQQTDTATDRRDWISSVSDCDDGYHTVASRHHSNNNNNTTSPNRQISPSPIDTLQSLAVRHLLQTDNGRSTRLLRDSDALAAALEQYGMPFDLDGGSTHNMNSADSTTAMGDVSCLDPSLARLDWIHSNGETTSNEALPSSGTSPLSSSDIDKYMMSPASHHLPSLSSSSSSSSSSASSSSTSSSSSTALTLGSLTTPVSDWSTSVVADTPLSNSSNPSLLKSCCNRPHPEGTDDHASCPNNSSSSSSSSSTALLDETSSPLYTAISLGNMDMARLLVRSGAKLDLPDRNGDTLLHHCIQRGDVTTSSALLDLGANVLHTTAGGRTPLHLAVTTGNEAMVTMLLDWCANDKNPPFEAAAAATMPTTTVTTTTTKQNTAVPTSSGRKISLLGHFIDACDAHNMTALHLAVKLQRIDVLKVLLEYGANVNLGCH
ncbi:Ankyrin repeat domain protein [Pyrenophora tritici-repentis]|nr:Ankyrin repeat domain protein [Pyrenophora tritici-repentis]KAI1683332.1 Ankyrin repeat domain protein [Pyrenophora tritici-repentis]